ncbi:MAG TPA: hypothetical protein VGD67_05485 [Pseudonocardiaceae bacterium]
MSASEQDRDVERGAAEESSGAPLTDMEREVSRPPGEDDAHGSGRDAPPREPAEGSREYAEYAEARVEREQDQG